MVHVFYVLRQCCIGFRCFLVTQCNGPKIHHHHNSELEHIPPQPQASKQPALLRSAAFIIVSTQTLFIHLATMADEDEIAALVIDNGSGMCKGGYFQLLIRYAIMWWWWGEREFVVGGAHRRRCVVSIRPRRSNRRRRRSTTAHAWA